MTNIFYKILMWMIIGLLVFMFNHNLAETKNKEIENQLSYALKQATKDSTNILINVKTDLGINTGLSGLPDKEIQLAYNDAMDQFQKSLEWSTKSGVEVGQFKKEYIPLIGVIGKEGVYIYRWDHVWLPVIPYSYTDKVNDRIYLYTLGDKVKYYDFNGYTTDPYVGLVSSSVCPVSGFPSHENFKQNVIMETINRVFTQYLNSKEDNINVYNYSYGTRLLLPHADYKENKDNVIATPGVFAVMEVPKAGDPGNYFRIIDFVGSQLRYKK